MPSSISNSSIRAKKYLKYTRWTRFWPAVIIVFFCLIASWELLWRYRGFTPSITDDWPVWSALRREANNSENSLALVGSSRILLGIDPEILEKTMQRPVYMLAIDGSDPLPVLAHLAADPDFIGDVICSITPYWLGGEKSSSNGRSAKWLRKYSSQPLSSVIENHLSMLIQAHLVFRYSGLSPSALWDKWRTGEAVLPPYAPMRRDRYRPADYSLADLPSLRAARVKRTAELHKEIRMLEQDQLMQRILQIQKSVDRIRARGGEVFFLSLPTCGLVEVIEEKYVPRGLYWDVFTRQISAVSLHSKDDLHFEDFTCTDGSHLNYNDAERFTRLLAAMLEDEAQH